jgi:hypothetical protein
MYRIAPDNLDALMELSYATNSLGSLAMKLQQFEQATAFFDESLTLKLLVKAKTPDNTALIADIADTRSWLASAALANGEIQQSVALHQQIQSEFEQLATDVKSDAYLIEKVFSSYSILADVYHYQGAVELGFDKLYQAYALLSKALEQDPDHKVWQSDIFHLKVVLMRINASLHDDRISYTPELLKQQLDDRKPQFSSEKQYMRVYGNWLFESALYYQALEQQQQSIDFAVQAQQFYAEQHRGTSDDPRLTAVVAEVELLRAAQYKAQLQHEKSQQSCRKAKELLQPLQQRNKNPAYVQPYARALDCLELLEQDIDVQKFLQKNAIKLDVF